MSHTLEKAQGPRVEPMLHVLVYPSRLFAAHWSFWLPHISRAGKQLDTGSRIHVTGDRLNGFHHEFVRDYSARDDDRRPAAYPIGLLSTPHLVNDDVDTLYVQTLSPEGGTIGGPRNAFERACRDVEAPGPSLNKVAETDLRPGAVRKRAEIRDCQWWIRQATTNLVDKGILMQLPEKPPPKELVQNLPKH